MARPWAAHRLPSGFPELWHVELRSLADLAGLRARVLAAVTTRSTTGAPVREQAAEQLVLVADELASNALRHGAPPVLAALHCRQDDWLFAVSDGAPAVPPVPARGRDPARGGLGLHLVADLSQRHGWYAEDGAKTTWAVVRVGAPPGAGAGPRDAVPPHVTDG